MPIKVIELEKYFSYQTNIARLKRLAPAAKSPIMDLIYPAAKQDTYPKSRLAAEDLPSAVKNLPVIQRGSASYVPAAEKQTIQGYEPFPIEADIPVSDAQLNDLRNLTEEDINGYLDLKVARLKESCKATAEALAVQSLTGAISYAAQTSPGVFDSYEASFGSTKSLTVTKLWDASGTGINDIVNDLSLMADLIGEDGFDSNIALLAGSSAFRAAVGVANSGAAKGIKVIIDANSIQLPGFTIYRVSGKYYDYKTKAYVKGIADNKVCAIGTDAPFWFPYCSLDNAEANFQALPFWASVKRAPTGKGYLIQGESKPFPVPVVNAICWATVTA